MARICHWGWEGKVWMWVVPPWTVTYCSLILSFEWLRIWFLEMKLDIKLSISIRINFLVFYDQLSSWLTPFNQNCIIFFLLIVDCNMPPKFDWILITFWNIIPKTYNVNLMLYMFTWAIAYNSANIWWEYCISLWKH